MYYVLTALRALVSHPQPADSPSPMLLPSDVDIFRLFSIARDFDLLHVVWQAYSTDPRLASLSDSPFPTYVALATEAFRLQQQHWSQVSMLMDDLGISHCAIKGLPIYATWSGLVPRLMYDIDLLIPRESIELVRESMNDVGYSQGTDKHKIHQVERNHYELASFSTVIAPPSLQRFKTFLQTLSPPYYRCVSVDRHQRNERPVGDEFVALLVNVDIHHNVLLGFPCRELWEQTKVTFLGSRQVLTLAWELTAWLLATRCCVELQAGDRRATRQLGDLAIVISRPDFDFDRLLFLARRYSSQSILYYSLSFLRDLGGAYVPREVLRRLEAEGRPGLARQSGAPLTRARAAGVRVDEGDFVASIFSRRHNLRLDGKRVVIRPRIRSNTSPPSHTG